MVASNTSGCRATVQQLLQQIPGWKQMVLPGSHKVLSRIERCRTADFGYHAYRCTDSECGAIYPVGITTYGVNMSIIAAATGTARVAATIRKKSG